MKERPILFSTPMVRAILEGRKSQTRRIIKPQPESVDHINHKMIPYNGSIEFLQKNLKCPYGKSGDVLWVRETWCLGRICETETINPCDAESYVDQCLDDNDIIYKEQMISNGINIDEVLWKPSIFMPKIASRIKLKVTNVRVERVQDITDEDALVEGMLPDQNIFITNELRLAYKSLWESINGKGSWENNPWVWVIEFEKL
jgi:hypothetical protein